MGSHPVTFFRRMPTGGATAYLKEPTVAAKYWGNTLIDSESEQEALERQGFELKDAPLAKIEPASAPKQASVPKQVDSK